MRPPKPFPAGTVERLQALLRTAKRTDEMRRIQVVLMRALNSSPPTEIAATVGWTVNSVRCLHSRFLKEGFAVLENRPGRGGRRSQNIDEADEVKLLEKFEDQAISGGVLVTQVIKDAYEKQIGRSVAASTITRMMARHGWRKIAPRSYHPKKRSEDIEPFKKNSQTSTPKK